MFTSQRAVLQNIRRCLKMLCFLVTGKRELKLGSYEVTARINEGVSSYFGECEVKDKTIKITLTPLALCNDYIFKRTICHEFVHALFTVFGKDKAREILKGLVEKALDYLEGKDPYNGEVSGEEYANSEEMYCFFLEHVLSLLLYVATEWDAIREVEYRIYREFLKGGDLNVAQQET
jgi:hypothetical protein